MTNMQIENIIAFAQISKILDIKLLSEKITDSIYNPSEFDGLSIKYDNEKIAIIILESGKIYCTGAKKINDAADKIKKVAIQIKEIGFNIIQEYKVIIENIIVSIDFKKELNITSLAKLAKKLFTQDVDYHPETFPGLIYKMDDFQTILIIFNSGKIVCTGAKSIEKATNSIKKIEEKFTSIGVL